MFQDRFRRSLVAGGFGKKVANALSMALGEMTDNIIVHSGIDDQHQANGLVGYHVEGGTMTFAIADIGRGVVESLRTNPAWAHVSDAKTALQEAVLGRATRRAERLQGDGFQQVFRALSDINGTLRFRSGDAYLSLDGRGDDRKRIAGHAEPRVGFQLAITCSLGTQTPYG